MLLMWQGGSISTPLRSEHTVPQNLLDTCHIMMNVDYNEKNQMAIKWTTISVGKPPTRGCVIYLPPLQNNPSSHTLYPFRHPLAATATHKALL